MSNEELNTEMNGESLDVSEQKKRELAQLFPGAFTYVYEHLRERYGMEWPGKKEALKLIQQPLRATLKSCRDESFHFENRPNLFYPFYLNKKNA